MLFRSRLFQKYEKNGDNVFCGTLCDSVKNVKKAGDRVFYGTLFDSGLFRNMKKAGDRVFYGT